MPKHDHDPSRALPVLRDQLAVLERLIQGDPSVRFSETAEVPEIARLGSLLNAAAQIQKEMTDQSMELSLAIAQFMNVLTKVGQGDLKARAPVDFDSEVLGALGLNLNQAIEKIEERSALENLLKELSTPVLHAWEGVIVMPLIGTLTSNRAQDAMECVLRSITEYHARVAIIDITGVPVIDSMVAQHLIKTVKAVKILGAEAVITGISAEVASILVKIGIEVEQLVTRSSLREGLQTAIGLIEGKQ